jgi:tetratricopeptide (TPR) repeat protein
MQSDTYWTKKQGQELFDKALQLDADGKTSEAIDAYQQSLTHWPTNSQANYNLGVALATSGNLDQALRAWKRAIWLEPSFKMELIKAFDIDDELREEIIGRSPEDVFAKAA